MPTYTEELNQLFKRLKDLKLMWGSTLEYKLDFVRLFYFGTHEINHSIFYAMHIKLKWTHIFTHMKQEEKLLRVKIKSLELILKLVL